MTEGPQADSSRLKKRQEVFVSPAQNMQMFEKKR